MKRRREELEALRKLGIETYPYSFNRTAASKTFMNEIGPEAMPPVERTVLDLDRRREKENPVPPPDL